MTDITLDGYKERDEQVLLMIEAMDPTFPIELRDDPVVKAVAALIRDSEQASDRLESIQTAGEEARNRDPS
jgi:hypothetical protein